MIKANLAITPELIDATPELEAIASISVGYDNYPIEKLTRRGILLCNTSEVLTETNAETKHLVGERDFSLMKPYLRQHRTLGGRQHGGTHRGRRDPRPH